MGNKSSQHKIHNNIVENNIDYKNNNNKQHKTHKEKLLVDILQKYGDEYKDECKITDNKDYQEAVLLIEKQIMQNLVNINRIKEIEILGIGKLIRNQFNVDNIRPNHNAEYLKDCLKLIINSDLLTEIKMTGIFSKVIVVDNVSPMFIKNYIESIYQFQGCKIKYQIDNKICIDWSKAQSYWLSDGALGYYLHQAWESHFLNDNNNISPIAKEKLINDILKIILEKFNQNKMLLCLEARKGKKVALIWRSEYDSLKDKLTPYLERVIEILTTDYIDILEGLTPELRQDKIYVHWRKDNELPCDKDYLQPWEEMELLMKSKAK